MFHLMAMRWQTLEVEGARAVLNVRRELKRALRCLRD
jgi:hypothetical protein